MLSCRQIHTRFIDRSFHFRSALFGSRQKLWWNEVSVINKLHNCVWPVCTEYGNEQFFFFFLFCKIHCIEFAMARVFCLRFELLANKTLPLFVQTIYLLLIFHPCFPISVLHCWCSCSTHTFIQLDSISIFQRRRLIRHLFISTKGHNFCYFSVLFFFFSFYFYFISVRHSLISYLIEIAYRSGYGHCIYCITQLPIVQSTSTIY